MTTQTLEAAKNIMIKYGAVEFKGSTENFQTISAYNKYNERIGSIYSSYDNNYKKIFRLRF